MYMLIVCRDVSLQIGEFRLLCQNIFRNERGERYEIPESTLTEMFDAFDKDGVSCYFFNGCKRNFEKNLQ